MFQSLAQFYNSDEWRSFRGGVINDRLTETGETICSECGKPIVNAYDCIAHHEKPLTMQNVNDYNISLNPANIKLVHGTCHNVIHGRFGYTAQRKVYYVYGAPCSGKTTYVNSIKGNSDLVVDMDNIWQCITGGERYNKPNALKQNAFAVRDCLLDMIRTRAGKWERAFVITGGASKGARMREIESLGAEPIFIQASKENCLQRLASAKDARINNSDEWKRYIEEWFDTYTE